MQIILTQEESITKALGRVLWIDEIKKELQNTVDFSKSLTVADIEDKEKFKIIKDTKNWYVKTRNTIKRAFKFMRDKNTQENKDNLIAERDVIFVIESEENRLNDLVKKAELEKLKKDNVLKLEDRFKLLVEYDTVTSENELLVMSDKEFDAFLLEKKELHLAKLEVELEAENQRLAREKELEDARKQAKIEAKEEMKVEIEEKIEKEVEKRVVMRTSSPVIPKKTVTGVLRKILTQETRDNLMKELQRLEDFAIQDPTIQDTYFPHTLYEIGSILDVAIGQEIEYKDWDKFKKTK